MSNKISITYENGQFNVSINVKVLLEDKKYDLAISKFRQLVSDNSVRQNISWESIKEELKSFSDMEELEIDDEYKNLAYGAMKYFYMTDKIFYIKNGQMVSLASGINLFIFVLRIIKETQFNNYKELLELCNIILENEANYRMTDTSFFATSPGFNYGAVEYNFLTCKINKGSSIEKCTFEEFKNYIIERLK